MHSQLNGCYSYYMAETTGKESLTAARTSVAALYVQTDGAYFGLDGVEPWDEQRDARLYLGPYPVVAHPPCSRWCQLAPVNEARYGTPVGHDKGCFAAALESVERYGGVLEHPAYTLAWHAFDIRRPKRDSWQQCRIGWVTEVSQSAYGCPARKRTWLYYVGPEPPAVDWSDPAGEAVIGGGINSGECVGRRKIGKREASAIPPAFRDLLLSLARGVEPVSSYSVTASDGCRTCHRPWTECVC